MQCGADLGTFFTYVRFHVTSVVLYDALLGT